jgi:hypothetical protein
MKARALDTRIGSAEERRMPGTHIGGTFHGTSHAPEMGPHEHDLLGARSTARPEPLRVSVAPQPGASPAGSGGSHLPQRTGHFIGSLNPASGAATSDTVLRLRGGGNAHGSERKDDDREHLVPEGAGSSSGAMYHGTRSGSEAQRAANEAKRYDLQGRLDDARRKLDDARRRHDTAIADLERISTAMKSLAAEQQQSGVDRGWKGETDRQYQAANDDFWTKTREVAESRESIRKLDDKRRSLERKLDKLRWT